MLKDSIRIHFRQNYSVFEENLYDNKEAIDSIQARILRYSADSTLSLRAVKIVGSASPEGSVKRNELLSLKRAEVIYDRISSNLDLPDSLMEFHYLGRDWRGLLKAVKADSNVPYRDDAIYLIEDIVENIRDGEREEDGNVRRLSSLHGGAPYMYMYRSIFPHLRQSNVVLSYRHTINLEHLDPIVTALEQPFTELKKPEDKIPPEKPKFYMALKTNMLYDAALVPNLGAEFYLGRNFSLGGGWMHAWWTNRQENFFWRIYGGELYGRYWFGRKAEEKPLQGHHIGIHAQALTYDFELGGRGYMGGLPLGTIKDRAHWGAGIEYGYSLPVAKRLNIDFGLTVGYLGGEYREYLPMEGHYVWQVTKYKHWFGPTKAEISLVWLLGRGNYNEGK